MQRAIYEGEHHQLGVIMAPDKHEAWAVQPRPVTLFHVITLKLFTRRKSSVWTRFRLLYHQPCNQRQRVGRNVIKGTSKRLGWREEVPLLYFSK